MRRKHEGHIYFDVDHCILGLKTGSNLINVPLLLFQFGAGLDVNVLTNMSTAGMAGLVGPHAAQVSPMACMHAY